MNYATRQILTMESFCFKEMSKKCKILNLLQAYIFRVLSVSVLWCTESKRLNCSYVQKVKRTYLNRRVATF